MKYFLDKIGKAFHSLLSLQINTSSFFSSLLDLRNCIPGFHAITQSKNCCEFDFSRNNSFYTIEPVFTKLHNGAETTIRLLNNSTSISELVICSRTWSLLEPIINDLNALIINPNITFHKLYNKPYNINDQTALFICDKDEIACISINGWIFPLVSSFRSFNSSFNPIFAILWNFKIPATIPLKKSDGSTSFLINFNSINPLSISLLLFGKTELVYIDKSKFYIKLSKAINTLPKNLEFKADGFKMVSFDNIACKMNTFTEKPEPPFSNIFYIYFLHLLLIFATGLSAMKIFAFTKLASDNSFSSAIPFFLLFLTVIGLFNIIFVYSSTSLSTATPQATI
ncbi:hypothetical protein GINT2_001397 [Glugoides intestinalis]